MADKKQSLVEEALLQMENLKEAVTENAKGILASTMKEEISQLVKESLLEGEKMEKSAEVEEETAEGYQKEMAEQEDETEMEVDDLEIDLDNDSDDEELDMDVDDDGDVDMDDLMMADLPGDDLEVDDEDEVLDVDDLTLDMEDEMMAPLDLTMATDDEILSVFKKMGEEDGIIVQQTDGGVNLKDDNEDVEYEIKMEGSENSSTDDIIYEIEISEKEEMEEEMEEGWNEIVDEEMEEGSCGTHEGEMKKEMEMDEMEMKKEMEMDEMEMKKEMEMDEMDTDEMEMKKEEMEEVMDEMMMDLEVEEGEHSEGDYKEGEHSEGEHSEGEMDEMDMEERSLAQGQRKGVNPDGSPKGGSKPGTGPVPNKLLYRKMQNEVKELRSKNQEYKKALDIFREKLNEVAVFNSNLAYATRLFTEHTTTKQEKINILRKFDGVETLKESKSLYKTIKTTLNGDSTQIVKESIESKVEKTPSNGSATSLIENKTYENPQFMRMRDLMKKLK